MFLKDLNGSAMLDDVPSAHWSKCNTIAVKIPETNITFFYTPGIKETIMENKISSVWLSYSREICARN